VEVGTELGWSEVSKDDTAIVGRPAKTIPLPSSSSMLMEGSGVKVAGLDPGSIMVGGVTVRGSTMVGGAMLNVGRLVEGGEMSKVGTLMVEGPGSIIIGGRTISGADDLVGESNPILPISADKSPSLPSLISVTVEGRRLPVFFSYTCDRPAMGAAPIPLGRPLSRLLEATTATGGFGSGRLLGDPNPAARSSDLTDEMVSDRSRIEGDTGDCGGGLRNVEGPASGAECVLMGDGSGLDEEGRTVGDGSAGDLIGDPGVFGRRSVRMEGGGIWRTSLPDGGRGRA
jgi:hypothetical protein